MKRLLTIALFFIISIPIFAQKIKTDRIDASGTRFVETTEKSVGGPALANLIAMSLSAKITTDGISWFINLKVEESMPIPSGSAFLIKLQNDSIITLYSSSEASGTSQSIPINVGLGIVTSIPVHTAYACYPISYDDLQRIIHNEVVKIRVETPDKVYDRIIKGKMSKHASKMNNLISDCLKEHSAKGIYDEF